MVTSHPYRSAQGPPGYVERGSDGKSSVSRGVGLALFGLSAARVAMDASRRAPSAEGLLALGIACLLGWRALHRARRVIARI